MTKIEITSDAEQDLIAIYLYGVEHFGLNQAERYSEMLHAKINTIPSPKIRVSAPITASSEMDCDGMRASPTPSISNELPRVFVSFGSCTGAWTPVGIFDEESHDKKNPWHAR